MEQPQQIVDGAGLWNGRLLVFDELLSTNTWAREHWDLCRHGDIVRAVRQTHGRGRFERRWFMEGETGLAVSAVIRAPSFQPLAPNAAQAAALAVHATLAAGNVRAALKWPNDVLVEGRKIAGILAEAADSDGLVVGIGLNVNTQPEDLRAPGLDGLATSILMETSRPQSLQEILARLTRDLQSALDHLSGSGVPWLLERWRAHDWLAGRAIRVSQESRILEGTYAGLDENGWLLLRQADGQVCALSAGDVTLHGTQTAG